MARDNAGEFLHQRPVSDSRFDGGDEVAGFQSALYETVADDAVGSLDGRDIDLGLGKKVRADDVEMRSLVENSAIKEMPGPEVDVIARAPAQPAPIAIPIAASSSSAWTIEMSFSPVFGSVRNLSE